jgi:hypothetical protein
MRLFLASLLVVCLAGCQTDKVDMSTVKSPDAGAPAKDLGLSKKPSQPPYKTEKGGGDTSLIIGK